MAVETPEAPVAELPSGPSTQAPVNEPITQAPAAAPSTPADNGPVFGDSGEPDRPVEAPQMRRGPDGRFVPREPVNQPIAPQGSPPPDKTLADPLLAALPPAPPQDWFTGDVVKHAAFYGLSEDEARGFGDQDKLYAALAAIDRRLMAYEQPQHQAPQPVNPATPYPAGSVPSAQPTSNPAGGFAIDRFDFSPFAEKFDEDTNKAFEALSGHYQKQLEKFVGPFAQQQELLQHLGAAYQQMDEFVAQQEGKRFEQELDSYFEKLGDDYAEVFGKGPISELTDGRAVAARRDFASKMVGLTSVNERFGRGPSKNSDVFQQTLRAYYGGVKENKIREQVRQEVAKRQSQAVAPPTGRTTNTPLDPLRAAAQRANELYRARGFDVQEFHHDGEI